MLGQQSQQAVRAYQTQQAQVQRAAGRAEEQIGRQKEQIGVAKETMARQQLLIGRQRDTALGAQSAQAGKVGLAGSAGSFSGMQQQVRSQAGEELDIVNRDLARADRDLARADVAISRTRQEAAEDVSQLQSDIKTTTEMAAMRTEQSLLGDLGLNKIAGQNPDHAFFGGLLSGGLGGFQAAGGDIGGAIQGLGGIFKPKVDLPQTGRFIPAGAQ